MKAPWTVGTIVIWAGDFLDLPILGVTGHVVGQLRLVHKIATTVVTQMDLQESIKNKSVRDLLPGWGGRSARGPQAPLVFQFETRSWESCTRTWWLFHRLHGPFACEPKILSEWQSWRHRRRIGRTLPQRANELSLCGPPWQSVKSSNFLSICFRQINVHLFLRLKKVRLQLMHLCLLLRSATTWMWK